MIPRRTAVALCAVALVGLLPLALAHGDELEDMKMDMGMDMGAATGEQLAAHDSTQDEMTYFRYGHSSGWMYGHILAMIVSWFVVLPVGVMFSIARSRYTLPAQLAFLATNALGVVLSVIYRANVPNLYEGNVHYRMGWLFTWVALAWVVMGVLNMYARSRTDAASNGDHTMSTANLTRYQRIQQESIPQDRRWSRDSGQGTERNSASLFGSGTDSPSTDCEDQRFDDLPLYANDSADDEAEKHGFLHNTPVDRFLTANIHRLAVGKTLAVNKGVYIFLERTMILLGWSAFLTGNVVFAGLMRDKTMFNGLAHFIKGSIFFWYGLLTLGRWMGAFTDFGWAWNVKPTKAIVGKFAAWVPSGEFTESFVIFLYGITNVWLEHLAAWGEAWAPEDFEHVSITILFAGGGLLGMLIESKRIRDLLSTSMIIAKDNSAGSGNEEDAEKWAKPRSYSVSLNPMPGLIILLLGLMMSSHTQHSMTSSMLHKQWGTLFVGFALARAVTYILLYLSPPTSYFASRPPSEIVSSFCLVSGGALFMMSTSSVVAALDNVGAHAMIVFTVGMGFTAMVMAWATFLMGLLGWARRKENAALFKRLDAEVGAGALSS